MKKSKIRVFCMRFLLAVGICVVSLLFIDHMTEWQAHISPKYSRTELKPILDRAAVRQSVAQLESLAAISSALDGYSEGAHDKAEFLLTEDEYDLIYRQTGLGRSNIDTILRKPDGEKALHEAQETFFTDPEQTCIRDNWFSSREQTIDENGDVIRATELTGVEDGDIIVTKSSHVFGWRNGHAALVVDAENRKTLEAIVIGENTGFRRFKKWEKYPNYLVLRLAGVDSEQRAEIARWAEQNLADIPYQLTAGFFGAKAELLDALDSKGSPDSPILSISPGSKDSPILSISPDSKDSPISSISPDSKDSPVSLNSKDWPVSQDWPDALDSSAAGARTGQGRVALQANREEEREGAAERNGSAPTPVTGTQCAHLIWRAYAQFGYDLDENGGWLITPKQLTKSSLLEVVQVYGMDPDNPWP